MPLPIPKTGPLTPAELEQLWLSVVDPSYSGPIVEGGEGSGLEAIRQAFAQYERLSVAVDTTTQEMFILPWSGQSNEPAGNARRAQVTLTVTRTSDFARELTFQRGLVFAEEETTDMARNGPEVVHTGRRYRVLAQRTLGPGEAGPLLLPCEATLFGHGFDNPAIGTIRALVEPGAGFANLAGTVVLGADDAPHQLLVANQPDVVIPEHIGQYLRFNVGANLGQMRRVVGYQGPNPPVHGGVALLAPTGIFRVPVVGGPPFQIGEQVEQLPSGARGRFVHLVGDRIIIDRTFGTFVVGQVVAGLSSGAAALIDAIDQDPNLVAETGTAGWDVLGWTNLGVAATNTTSPTGGRLGMLDELGAERRINRASGEDDESYRRRVATVADVVSPGAILRRANRVYAPYGGSACLREVGLPLLRGLMLDGDPGSLNPDIAYASDLDFVSFPGFNFIAGAFFPGEKVQQNNGGVIAEGRAILEYPAVAPGTPLPAGSFTGVVGVRGTFVPNVVVTGLTSGATAEPSAVIGGLQERDRFKLLLDYLEFRAFFLVSVPKTSLGEFGLAYDVGATSAYDASPFLVFYDGLPATTATLQRSVWQAVNEGRAGGVGFDLDNHACF